MELERYDQARAAIARQGFSPDIQTKISLFLSAAKNAHVVFLGASQWTPSVGAEQQLLHTQYFRELEGVMLLSKVTRWSPSLSLYNEAVAINAPIWKEWPNVSGLSGGVMVQAEQYYTGLALGHALLSQLRLVPVIPGDTDESDPFVMALRRIELDNARMQQTQMALLRTAAPQLDFAWREDTIEAKQALVQEAFVRFLAWLE